MLSIQNITKSYSNHTALSEVSFEVNEKKIFGLLGPNGAGKTSLIRIINQITRPDSGQILFNGSPIRPKHEQYIGYLPEERGLYKKMEVGEQLLYLAQLKGLSKQEAMKRLKIWFEKFEISSWWNKKIEELSKGMQQKVQFIVTVLHEPQLLILDEPFSGFDPINAALIRNEILELRNKGATIILSTHNMASVEEICDDIALIYQSKKILDGTVVEVKENEKENEFLIRFKGDLIAFTQSLWVDAKLISKKEVGGYHEAKVKLLNDKQPNDLLKAVIPHVEVHSLNEVIPSMNEVFIKKVEAINNNSHA
ncbi:MAG: ATP-binding cassette domain-containing protein [Flavobacteriales bacterium]|nr:ATP-binding cassette domain-containing protein [Flavobacteriales bacterium]